MKKVIKYSLLASLLTASFLAADSNTTFDAGDTPPTPDYSQLDGGSCDESLIQKRIDTAKEEAIRATIDSIKNNPSDYGLISIEDKNLEVSETLFQEDAEKTLNERYNEVTACKYESYELELDALLGLKPELDSFFENVMVNVENEAVKNNRKALIAKIYKSILKIADIKEVSI